MRHDAFRDREQAEEAAYFVQRDARLIDKICARASLGEIAAARADKLHGDDPQLPDRIVALGVTRDTAATLRGAPTFSRGAQACDSLTDLFTRAT